MNIQFRLADESFKYKNGIGDGWDGADARRSRIELISGRRDWAAFQVLARADEEFSLSVGKRPAFSPRGALMTVRVECALCEIPGFSVSLYPVGLIEDDDRTLKADLLLKDEVVHVQKDEVQPVWVEIQVAEGVTSGIYRSELRIYGQRMFEDEKVLCSFPLELQVKDVLLPLPKDYSFYLDLWQHLSNIARKHEVHLWSDAHFAVMENYVESLAGLGQKAITVIASEIPWSGQRCFLVRNYPSDLFEYNMVQVEKDTAGYFRYDFSAVARYVELCFKYGINREIEVFGLTNIWMAPEEGYGKVAEDYPDGIRIRYLDRADGCYKYMKHGDEIKQYIQALAGFFREKGWMDIVRIVADEPADIERYRESLEMLTSTVPDFTYKTAVNHAEFIGEFQDKISDFVPALGCVCQEWDLLEKMRASITGRLLWYVCCGPDHPNTFICSPLLESRLIGILTAFMGFDGFLRWNYTVWPENPRQRISFLYPHWKAGDTNFVYPAANGAPVLTLRYKNLKRGIEDFELISLLKRIHPDPDTVLDKVWELILKARNIKEFDPVVGKKAAELYSLDFSDYQGMKRLLLEELEKLSPDCRTEQQ